MLIHSDSHWNQHQTKSLRFKEKEFTLDLTICSLQVQLWPIFWDDHFVQCLKCWREHRNLHNEVSYAVKWQYRIVYALVPQSGEDLQHGVRFLHHIAVVLFLEGHKLQKQTYPHDNCLWWAWVGLTLCRHLQLKCTKHVHWGIKFAVA